MNTIVTPDSAPVANLTPLAVVSAPVEVKLRMTPEEIREFVAKARAADAEKGRAQATALETGMGKISLYDYLGK